MKSLTHIVGEQEDDLINQCIRWDKRAQNMLYKQYSSKMFAVCFRYSRNREEAEDILQEGFMKVFDKINTFKREGSLEGWIRRIMVNTAIQKFRERKSSAGMIVNVETYPENIDLVSSDDAISQMGAKELMGLIQELSPAYQMVFNLYVFEGLKHREIAERLGISEGTSKSNLADARSILKNKLNNLKSAEATAGNYGRK
jgi:RNA polymerase sigma-70 factor (ECF subfamily)